MFDKVECPLFNTLFNTATPGGTPFPALDKTLFTVAPIANVTGFRIVTSCTWPNYPIGMNIAEVELYAAAVPEPSLLALVLAAGATLSLPRRRTAYVTGTNGKRGRFAKEVTTIYGTYQNRGLALCG